MPSDALLAWLLAGPVLLAAATLLWVFSVRLRNASIIDPFWGPAFVLAAGVYLWALPGAPTPRGLLVFGLTAVWGTRLGVHLGRRAIGAPEDSRYAAMRERNGPEWWWTSLFRVFWLQAALVWLISLPLWAAAASTGGVTDPLVLLGVALFVVGFLFEAVGDAQLDAFRRDPDNRGRVLDTGVWRYTRHPNYFGDALLWWGLGTIGAASGGPWFLLSPLVMTGLLLKVSGVPLLEDRLRETRPGYADYVRRTSAFVPWFPKEKA